MDAMTSAIEILAGLPRGGKKGLRQLRDKIGEELADISRQRERLDDEVAILEGNISQIDEVLAEPEPVPTDAPEPGTFPPEGDL